MTRNLHKVAQNTAAAAPLKTSYQAASARFPSVQTSSSIAPQANLTTSAGSTTPVNSQPLQKLTSSNVAQSFTPSTRNASRFSHGMGLANSVLGVYGNLTNNTRTPEGVVYDDPQYGSAAINAGVGALQAVGLRNAIRPVPANIPAAKPINALRPAVNSAPVKRFGGTVAKNIGPILGGIGAVSRLFGEEPDYTGAAIDTASFAAPFIGSAIGGGPFGKVIGEGVGWGLQGINTVRDILNNRENTKLPSQKKPYQGVLGQSAAPPEVNLPYAPQQSSTQPLKIASTMSTFNNSFKTTKAFASGFIKAALEKNLSIDDFSYLVKKAIASSNNLTYDDIASIKDYLAGQNLNNDIYSDASGTAAQKYHAQLLAERDAALSQIPELSGLGAGSKSGLVGAAIGGSAGGLLGATAKHSGLLNVPYKYLKNLPTIGALAGTAIGGIVSAIPAAKQKYEAVKALQKLQNPKNIANVGELITQDNSILNR